jgi:hypothetical protein
MDAGLLGLKVWSYRQMRCPVLAFHVVIGATAVEPEAVHTDAHPLDPPHP